MKLLLPAAVALATVAFAAIASSATTQEYCGRNDLKVVGDYTVYNNLWGQDNDKNGKQCTEVLSSSDTSVSWKTSYKWAGDNWQVKSFANAALTFTPTQLSAIQSIPMSIKYTYSYESKVIANVACDLFTSSSPNGTIDYELMVWLAALGGAWPLSSSGKPLKTVTVNYVDFDLYQGMNGDVKVFSFVAKEVTPNFSADLKEFFGLLPSDNGVPSEQYLQKVETGTEPFQGNANMTVLSYSARVN